MNQTLFYAPFLRILFPFIGGILIRYFFDVIWISIVGFSLASVVLFLWIFLKGTFHRRYLFGVFVTLFCFASGNVLMHQSFNETDWNDCGTGYYDGVMQEYPIEKKKTMLCRIQLDNGQRVMVYLPKDSLSQALLPGQKIRFSSTLSPLEKSKEPQDFDYALYLKMQGYAASGFVAKGQWEISGYEFNLKYKALEYRTQLVEIIQDFRLSEDAYAFGTAMLLGCRDLMDDDVEKSFAVAGISHVISISGLHTQIIFMMLFFVFGFMGNRKKAKVTRHIIILLLMWIFTFISGLSPSVIRASAMLSIYGVGEILSKKMFNLNAVYLSAFLMLFYNPLYLFDISFQLSYLAVLAIVVVYPMIEALHVSENKIVRYLWGSFCVSIAAQLATMPLCAYYFHSFPLYFWFSNIVLAPLVGPILIGMIIALPIHALVALPSWCYSPIDWMLQAIILTAEAVEQLPFASLSGFYPDEIQTLLSYGIIISAIVFFKNRKIQYIYLFQLFVLLQVIYYF